MFSTRRFSRVREGQPASLRFWLYLGAVSVGLGLMAISDPTAPERVVDAPQAGAPAAEGTRRAAEIAPELHDEAAALRVVTPEVGGRAGVIAPRLATSP